MEFNLLKETVALLHFRTSEAIKSHTTAHYNIVIAPTIVSRDCSVSRRLYSLMTTDNH